MILCSNRLAASLSLWFVLIPLVRAQEAPAPAAIKVLWQEEITPETDSRCSLGRVVFDSAKSRILIVGASPDVKTRSDGRLWLMEFDLKTRSVAKRETLRRIKGSKAALSASSMIGSVTMSPAGQVVLAGNLEDVGPTMMRFDSEASESSSLALFGKTGGVTQDAGRKRILNGLGLTDGSLILVGEDGGEGLVMKVDSEGTPLWSKRYRIGDGQRNQLTGCVEDGGALVVVGRSANPAGPNSKFPAATGENFVFKCDLRGDVIAKSSFPGGAWPGEEPQICRLTAGSFIVAYATGMGSGRSIIVSRAYSSELQLLWEKQAIQWATKAPTVFRLASSPGHGYALAANLGSGTLKVCQYDEWGNEIASLSKSNEAGPGDIGLLCVDTKAFAVFQAASSAGALGARCTVKILGLELQ